MIILPSKPDYTVGGHVVIKTEEGTTEHHTAQCIHCGYQWAVKPGSGFKRGWCPDCKDIVCGASQCMKVCAPFMARLELSEALNGGDTGEIQKILGRYEGIKPI